jgi:hypothetical protein
VFASSFPTEEGCEVGAFVLSQNHCEDLRFGSEQEENVSHGQHIERHFLLHPCQRVNTPKRESHT